MAVLTIDEFKRDLLGSGIVKPLRRLGSSDFVIASGERLVRAAIAQILGTRVGELRWRPEFGCDLEPYRHRNMSDTLAQTVADEVVQALATWEPRLAVSKCEVNIDDTIIRARVTWTLNVGLSAESSVLAIPVTQEVVV